MPRKNKSKTHNRRHHHHDESDIEESNSEAESQEAEEYTTESEIEEENEEEVDGEDETEMEEEMEEMEEEAEAEVEVDEVKEMVVQNRELEGRMKDRLKKQIVEWLDYDDKIKILNKRAKKYKDAKKEQEQIIMELLVKFGVENTRIDIHDDNDNLRSRVYRRKSVTKGAIKENIIRDALMEVIRDEKRVKELVKRIEKKRPINEKYYLSRTKGNQ